MFFGGDTLGEWETAGHKLALPHPFLSPRSKWEDVNHAKVVAARLWCPNGQIGEVRATGPNRVIQFKVATAAPGVRSVEAHVLGVLTDGEGGCQCYEWRPDLAMLGRFEANILTLHDRYKVGPFSLDALDLKL